MKNVTAIILVVFLASCQGKAQEKKSSKKSYAVKKTDAEWKSQLPDLSYKVLRKAATEYAFSGEYNETKKEGTYLCLACSTPLYESKHKFDSKSGWPSFDRGIEGNIEYDSDYNLGYKRTELKCNTCGGHLGHSFQDGPRATTGIRHCINSAALNFKPSKKNE